MMTKKRTKKIRKGDRVIAIAGNERGRSGEVLAVIDDKVLVQGLNVRKKHMKATRESKGSIVSRERPIHRSNVMVCTSDDTPIKLKVHTTSSGERQLVYIKDDKQEVYRTIKQKHSS